MINSMTEEKARTKWCPYALTNGIAMEAPLKAIGFPINRGNMGTVAEATRCLGSDCMKWEWIGSPFNSVQPAHLDEDDEGYCGLGSK